MRKKFSELEEATVPELISVNELETLYGISMNSVENALGMGYILARIYDDSASVLNVKYVYEYFASKFYHIQSSKLDDIYEIAILNNVFGHDNTDETDDAWLVLEYSDLNSGDDAYSESTLEAFFATYATYY